MGSMLTPNELEQYQRDGYIIRRGLFDEEEIGLLRHMREVDPALTHHRHKAEDGEGGVAQLTLWNDVADDLYGMFARCPRIVDPMEQMLGQEVYHWHSKMIQKDAFTGGAWAWHQDYGYWYDYGCLWPDLASVSIAIDPATRANGCMQVLQGSHKLGRVNHIKVGEQTGADPEHVDVAVKALPTVYCEMDAGDALFFHANVLHRSDQNRTPDPRWSLICCYNAARNTPYKKSAHASYTPLVRVSDSAIKEAGAKLTEKEFFVRAD